jgi:hypothetical protein
MSIVNERLAIERARPTGCNHSIELSSAVGFSVEVWPPLLEVDLVLTLGELHFGILLGC